MCATNQDRLYGIRSLQKQQDIYEAGNSFLKLAWYDFLDLKRVRENDSVFKTLVPHT